MKGTHTPRLAAVALFCGAWALGPLLSFSSHRLQWSVLRPSMQAVEPVSYGGLISLVAGLSSIMLLPLALKLDTEAWQRWFIGWLVALAVGLSMACVALYRYRRAAFAHYPDRADPFMMDLHTNELVGKAMQVQQQLCLGLLLSLPAIGIVLGTWLYSRERQADRSSLPWLLLMGTVVVAGLTTANAGLAFASYVSPPFLWVYGSLMLVRAVLVAQSSLLGLAIAAAVGVAVALFLCKRAVSRHRPLSVGIAALGVLAWCATRPLVDDTKHAV